MVVEATKNGLKTLCWNSAALIGTIILGRLLVLVCLPLELLLFVCTLALAVTIYCYKKYRVPVAVYAFVCALVCFRECFAVTTKSVPCGLCEYRSVCKDGRGREACTDWETEQGECWQNTEDMDWSLLWVAMPALLGTLYFMLSQLKEFHASKLDRWCKVRVMVIVMLPMTYAICGFYSLRLLTVNHYDLWTPRAIFDISNLYCAVGLLAFKYLVLECTVKAITKDYDLNAAFADTSADSDKKPEPSAGDTFVWFFTFQWVAEVFTEAKKPLSLQTVRAAQLDRNILNEVWRPLQSISRQLMRMGLLPYVLVCFTGNFAEILMKEFIDFWRPDLCADMTPSMVSTIFPEVKHGHVLPPATFVDFQGHQGSIECEDAWHAANIMLRVMNFVVCSTAVVTLYVYKRNMNQVLSLQGIDPDSKFWGVMILLLVNFWQSIVFYFAFEDPLKRDRYYSLLVCWEAFFLGFYQRYLAYPVKDFKDVASSAPSITAQTSILPTANLDDKMNIGNSHTGHQPLLQKDAAGEEADNSCVLM